MVDVTTHFTVGPEYGLGLMSQGEKMKRKMPFISLFWFLVIISCASNQPPAPEVPEPVTTSRPTAAATPAAPAPTKTPEPANAPAPAASPNPAPAAEKTSVTQPVTLILEGARRHRVVWGDTLSSLSKRYYGTANGYYFPVIMLASVGVVSHPDVIIPGMILTIPDLQKNLADPQVRNKIKSYLKDTAAIYERKRDTKTRNRLIQLSNSL
jgi:phage tail protein X